jgi:hypothetical protein
MKMKRGKRMVLKIIIAVMTAFAVGVTLYSLHATRWHYLYVRPWIAGSLRQTDRMRVRLLCETDHEILLMACNELSRRVERGDLKPGKYNVRRDPEASRFPQPILDLAPSSVYIDENNSGRVRLEMMGGLVHFGIEAHTEDYQMPSFGKFGDKELIPRLWYYDDGYIGHPEYEKRIEKLMQRGKMK